jgi:hypothetical protein
MSEAANRPEHPGRDNPGAGGASDVGLAGPVCPGQAGRESVALPRELTQLKLHAVDDPALHGA